MGRYGLAKVGLGSYKGRVDVLPSGRAGALKRDRQAKDIREAVAIGHWHVSAVARQDAQAPLAVASKRRRWIPQARAVDSDPLLACYTCYNDVLTLLGA